MTYLLVAVVVGVIGTLVVVAMHKKPQRPESAMAEFQREMNALAPRPPGQQSPSGPNVETRGSQSDDPGDRPGTTGPQSDHRPVTGPDES